VSGTARQILRDGDLDLRAATVLAVLAGKSPITLVDIVAVRAETAAGLPARTIVLRVRKHAVLHVLDSLPGAYRPASNRPVGGHAVRLNWRISLAAVGGAA
jgi:threonine dehydrogenase-like Zn-dependent dehydrogenase